MRCHGVVHTSVLIVLATIASVVVAVGVSQPEVVVAARQAPTSPQPQCVVNDLGQEGLGCVADPFGAAVGGQFRAGGSFTVTSAPGGLSPCLTYVSTGCIFELYDPTLVRCVYLANNDPTDVRSCGSLSTQGSVTAVRCVDMSR